MSRRKKEEPPRNPSRDPFFDVEKVASCTECTGILPAQIQTGEQGEDVAALQSIHRILARDPEEDGEY